MLGEVYHREREESWLTALRLASLLWLVESRKVSSCHGNFNKYVRKYSASFKMLPKIFFTALARLPYFIFFNVMSVSCRPAILSCQLIAKGPGGKLSTAAHCFSLRTERSLGGSSYFTCERKKSANLIPEFHLEEMGWLWRVTVKPTWGCDSKKHCV